MIERKGKKMECWLYGSARWEQKKDEFYEFMFLQPISLKSEHLSNTTSYTWLYVSRTVVLIFKFRFFCHCFIPKNAPSSVKLTAISMGRKWQQIQKITQEKWSKSIFQRIVYMHRASTCVRFSSTELIIVFWLFFLNH